MNDVTTIGEEVFTLEEVKKAAMEYFGGDELAATTWMNKYAVKNSRGQFTEKTPADMHQRMAREFARMEKKFDELAEERPKSGLSAYGKRRTALNENKIFNFFDHFRYVIPQGSVMAGLGNKHMIASLSNCVVVPPVYDSYGGICYTDEQLAHLFKRRCGVGVDISGLRPKNAKVSNAAGTTTGAITFMERFSNTTREVAQNGRRGALMLTIDIAHPDVEDFVTIKQDLKKVTGANISVRLSDEFMLAVMNDTEYTHRWPIDSNKPLHKKTVKARELWETIIKCAHNTAEPGLIFWDRQHRYSTSSVYPEYKNSSTNPCSEIAMQGGDSCRLIALNLFGFIESPFGESARFDYDTFYETVYESQRLSDDLVELELEHVQRILDKVYADGEPDYIKRTEIETWKLLYETGKNGRRTGLGFTALADALASLGLHFDSEEAMQVIDKIMRVKMQAEFDSSVDMAIERGSFKGFDPAIESESEFVKMMQEEFPELYGRMMEHGRRNISLSTVAPTGSLSLLAGTSSGLEPVYLLSYKRRRKVNTSNEDAKVSFVDDLGDSWEEFTVYHPKAKQWMEATGNNNIEESPYFGSTAPEIDWIKRVKIQSMVQKYITHSISSTINLPSDVSVEKVGEIYLESWKKGLKGITVYRDGSRSGVLVADDKGKEKEKEGNPKEATTPEMAARLIETEAPKRPKKLEADVIRFQNDYEKWIAVIGILDERPYEVFTGKMEDSFNLPAYVEKGWVIKEKDESGETRYDFQFHDKDGYRTTIEGLSRSFNKEFWNYAKLISGVLRHGMPINYVVDLVNNLSLYDEHINTWKNGVARSLKRYIPDGLAGSDRKCGSCGDEEGLIYEEGCLKCKSCGYTKCG